MKKLATLLLIAGSALLSGCGSSDDEPVLVASTNAVVPAAAPVVAAVTAVPFSFPSGVPDLGTTAATTVTFTSPSATATPTFNVTSGGNTATGTTRFGSCIFVVQESTFPTAHRLARGATVVVNPCNINVNTAGLQATGVGATRSVALALGAAVSAGGSVTVLVNPGGQLTLNGQSIGTVTLVPVTG